MKEVILFYGYKYWIWETSKNEEEIKAEAKANLYQVVAIRETDAPHKLIEPKLKKNDLSLRNAKKDYIKENFAENEIELSYREEILGSADEREIEKLQKENIELQKELDFCDTLIEEGKAYNKKIDEFNAWIESLEDDELLMELWKDQNRMEFDSFMKKYEPFIMEYLEKKGE